ncbi:ATP-binding protein [Agromyces archimandritae]|uniref:ATP-binding protein n=1 Tax=Agromyces archimandritae TaxID=2781962 RepID=A0A975IN55_9MICO|nr:ATP-binding protein [Agromyces archimandritae]QTX04205.1 ATP-binding protein [Agromyces archimandritae]
MTRISLEAGNDLVERLAHENDSVKAVVELVWNSLDADAHSVSVALHRNEADGVIGLEVTDDGHGMAPEELSSAFRWVGNSWKRMAGHSKGEQRPLHGRFGQGRLRAFALGTQIEWVTVADSTDGKRLRSVVRSSVNARNDFDVSDPVGTDEARGTRFVASGRDALDRLDADRTRDRITATFAPYLLARDNVELVYDGSRIQPGDVVDLDTPYDLEWEHEGVTRQAKLRIIEWKAGAERTIHLCDGEGVPVDALDTAPAADFQYSAYVMWDEMPEHHNEWILAKLESAPSALGMLLSEVDRVLDEHFEGRRAQRRRELVEEWKDGNVYPYQGEPGTEEEKVERATFDVVATSIRRHIPSGKKQKKLTLGLLRESLQQRPSDVSALLDEYVGLPADEKEQLERLLTRTSLSRVIQASSNVTNRLEFLRALELMVFDPEANKMVGERDHLHKILESELWVFGEQYNLMVSERGLTAALHRHRELLGEPSTDKTPVKLLDGKSGRLDLLLSVAATEHDRNRHLVVELKAPKVPAGQKELAQIKAYAMAVAKDPRFASSTTEWDFWLVTGEIDDGVRQEANQRGRERGVVFEPDLPDAPGAKVRVWVRDWGQIIDDAKRRLDYFQKSLQHDPSLDDARDYLRRNHGDVIPEGLLVDQIGNDAAVNE